MFLGRKEGGLNNKICRYPNETTLMLIHGVTYFGNSLALCNYYWERVNASS